MNLDPEKLTKRYHERGALDAKTVRAFRKAVLERFHANPRPMPWRATGDPYAILVSEVMLQQTQVERVRAKYGEFLAVFPTVASLAAAPLPEVLRVWQGLGYNRRALALKRCAGEIVGRFDGRFPATVAELESLPCIGHYTARAVAAFAFGTAEPFIETNIRTLYIHYFFHGRDGVADREIMPLVAATHDPTNPREWYYALMDCGVALKQAHPNPGRRSAHHVRQSRFEGSNRQLRSRMLRAIMGQPGVTGEALSALLAAEPGRVAANLAALEREGFIEHREEGYLIRGEKTKG